MNSLPFLEPDLACSACGRTGAHAFDGAPRCVDCYQAGASCCTDEAACPIPPAPPVPDSQLRLNPNCCYEACPSCSSVRRLREFQARHPRDWEARLVGSERLVRAARQHA